jgi:iron-sulfur cluster assembly protein
MAISLSASAAEQVQRQLQQRGHGLGLRLAVKASGCSGYRYVIDYADDRRSDDQVFSEHGVSVYVDPTSLGLIDGTRVDYVRQGLNSAFRFENPRAQGECGCGESFTVQEHQTAGA